MKFRQHILFIALIALSFCSCGENDFEKPDYYNYEEADTKLSQKIIEGSQSYIGHIKSVSETRITQGVTLLRMGYLNQKGLSMQLFLYKVSVGSISVQVSLPNAEAATGTLQTLASQAAAIENKGVYRVWGGISGGAFGSNGQPTGILYRNGAALNAQMGNTPVFFAILNDGMAVCLLSSDYEGLKPRIKEAVSGGTHLMMGGYVLTQSDSTTPARSAVGVSEDGGEVYLLVVDGSDFYYSNGITLNDIALLMKSCGAYNAMSLTNGNSVTAIWRNERLITLFDLLNKPANKGVAAEIQNGLVIVER